MPHEATVQHTDVLNNGEAVGTHMRAKETWAKSGGHVDIKQLTNGRAAMAIKSGLNIDEDDSSDEGSREPIGINQMEATNGTH